MKKYVFIFLVLFSGVNSIQSQEQTDLTVQQIRRYASHDFSSSRTFTLHSEASPAFEYAFKENGREVEKGKMNKNNTTKFTTILPVWTVNKFSLSVSGEFNSYYFTLTPDINNATDFTSVFKKEHYIYYTGMVGGTYQTTFLNKKLILNANIATNGWEKGLEKIQGTFAAMMALRTTERSYLGVGLYGTTHYNLIPVMPIIIYMNQLYSDVSLDITFPSYAFLRYQFCGNQRISLGTTLEKRRFYLNPEREDLPKISYFSEAAIKPELVYEYIINGRLYLKARTGMSAIVQSGIFNTNYKGIDWDPYMDFSRKMTSYFSVGLSYNLFEIKYTV